MSEETTFKKKCNELVNEAASWSSSDKYERERLQVAMDLFHSTFSDIMKSKTNDRRKRLSK